jgi:uncharacterized membrane protein
MPRLMITRRITALAIIVVAVAVGFLLFRSRKGRAY